MFYLFGLSITCFLVLLIVLKQGKTRSDYILLIWMAILAVHVSLFYMDFIQVSYHYPHLLGIALPLPVLHGALLYFYTTSITRVDFLKPSIIALCLLPFVASCFMIVPFVILPPEQKVYVYQHQGAGFEWFMTLQAILVPGCGLFFSLATIHEIRKHRVRMMNTFSNNDKKMLSWLLLLTISMALIWIVAIPFDDPIIFAGVVIFILLIGVMGINQAPVFYTQRNLTPTTVSITSQDNKTGEALNGNSTHHDATHPLVSNSSSVSAISTAALNDELDFDDANKYAKSGLKDEDVVRLKRTLDDFMKRSKPFKDANLSLDGLALALNLPANQLSQIINAIEGKTFYHYINMYRINEFLEIAALPESKKFTFLGLANDCGFSSKSTFNKYFKLHTGRTPSEYFADTRQNEPSSQY